MDNPNQFYKIPQPTTNKSPKLSLKNSVYFKIATIIIIILLLMIPTAMIQDLIYERETSQNNAIEEVSSKWGNEQRITGPYITIPYVINDMTYSESEKKHITRTYQETLYLLPKDLKINGKLKPEKRYRGIFEIVVYDSDINFSGEFSLNEFNSLNLIYENIQFDKAEMFVGITDLRGIEQQIKLNWNNESYMFNPGIENEKMISSGINSPISIDPIDTNVYKFNFNLNLKGSQLLYFAPIGKVTDVNITSNWQTPSFNGAFLPDSREVNSEGFQAKWNILHLNRNYPQTWRNGTYNLNDSMFGIELKLPIDNYQKSYRAIRYAFLIIALTFLVFFFIEILNKVFIHPIQYILVGLALVIFYTLLISISEHLLFNYAYLLSATGTLILIAGYVKAILKSKQLMIFISGLLTILYLFVYTMLQLEDFALLFGSVGVFVILGFVMYYSRKIDWYSINFNDKIAKESVIQNEKPSKNEINNENNNFIITNSDPNIKEEKNDDSTNLNTDKDKQI